jgi:hypothetical protein
MLQCLYEDGKYSSVRPPKPEKVEIDFDEEAKNLMEKLNLSGEVNMGDSVKDIT